MASQKVSQIGAGGECSVVSLHRPKETFRWSTPFFDLQFLEVKSKSRSPSANKHRHRRSSRSRGIAKFLFIIYILLKFWKIVESIKESKLNNFFVGQFHILTSNFLRSNQNRGLLQLPNIDIEDLAAVEV